MLALDVLLLMMIVVCIVYCWVLNQRIRDLHNSRVEFARMIKEFDAAVVKAENCISELSTLGSNATIQIKNASMDAQEIAHELKTVNDFGNSLGAKLERSISDARKLAQHLEETIAASESVSVGKTKRKKAAAPKISKRANFEHEEFFDDIVASKFKNGDELIPEQQNLLQSVLSKITTHKHSGTVSQSGFYDSLRKVSLGK
jgi:hypothetical protein